MLHHLPVPSLLLSHTHKGVVLTKERWDKGNKRFTSVSIAYKREYRLTEFYKL